MAAYEDQHVHQVYDKIASHFSATRYKPWPIVHEFLTTLPPGSVGIDVGCGNGKYLNINPNVFIVGSDRCENLVKIAKDQAPTQDVATADILSQPHRPSSFDFALSIAVIHHLSSPERRVEAIASILELLKPAGEGKALLYVWALEQKNSRRGWDENSEQDVLVPWVLTKQFKEPSKKKKMGDSTESESTSGPSTENTESSADNEDSKPFLRYYHLYKQGELEDNVRSAGGNVLNSGYEKDNWWAIVERTT
ncbi:tRNA methyltransferase, has a role in tRNA modification [Orbilia oligospora]|uniref:tRNA methyltransferase, has a role in tRNA modification n=1 Tax=Orbilia oligospora TaxID=2813651 RepID=A0A7C8J4L6_ORBOL|nr:tRNA methyltransferase, has a role in tRNA modification [Orbilia oligospora]KAF3088716.1 tRNA methyltransferase, has a role in tRNA modification [Orbilia oligospora]KAF3139938.1 tRNA methyltransferase, has a role in tRNA modification [Orbilia oligospora]